jgi:serine/threonine protein kinase
VECPSETTIAGLVDGALRPEARVEISDHLTRCDSCRELVAALAGPIVKDVRPRARTQQSLHHGRYLLERVLGEGGMGVVYRAYDTQLRRAIALKVVRPDRVREEPTGRVRERFLREAQAMAQLSHPHVVTVYDVGVDDDQVFVAMELVEGQTLREWSETPREVVEISDVLEQAGKGLAAAHATGLVHRDFKPDNVLVRLDGRVQVSDFGLARRYDSDEVDLAPSPPSGGPITGTLTATGATAGTPAYMSPEQWTGERASAASDQYAFCQVAWELFYGARPHGNASDVRELKQRIVSGTITTPARTTVPAGVERVLRRGLSREPSERFPEMTVLLASLASALRPERPARRRARPALFAAAGLVLAGAIAAPLVYRARTSNASVASTPTTPTAPTNTTTPTTPTAPPTPTTPPAAATTPTTPPAAMTTTQAMPSRKPAASSTTRSAPSRPAAREPSRPPKPDKETSSKPDDARPTKVDRTDAVLSDPWKVP